MDQKRLGRRVRTFRILSYVFLFSAGVLLGMTFIRPDELLWLIAAAVVLGVGVWATVIEWHYNDRRRRGW